MAQVVIFAPVGEDVSSGQTALEEAGHDVEVVEATAANLLHMAIGMVEGVNIEDSKEDSKEDLPLEPEEEDPLDDDNAKEPPKNESVGQVYVDDELVRAYVDSTRVSPLLRVSGLHGGAKLTYKINESTFSYWKDAGGAQVDIDGTSTRVAIGRTPNNCHIILDVNTARRLGYRK
ncbi:MAG: hypothetical protein DDT31_00040 [Syntrophomonadaceae bacterium]|nr:hypothetical protein [Bacillota bacterium]